MSKFTRLTALVLAVCLMLGSFSGCATKVQGTDAILSKGEFMLLFVQETCLSPVSTSSVTIDLDQQSPYYEAALVLAQIGHVTPEEAVEDLDYGVTKEFVATVCARNLYFRETSNVTLKDASKLDDAQACKDAVGHGIVSIENGYFDGNQEMTYWECMDAIHKMMEIDATHVFDEDDLELEVDMKDGVQDLSEMLENGSLTYVDPSDPDFQEIMDGMVTTATQTASEGQSGYGISLLSTRVSSNEPNLVPLAGEKNVCSPEDAEEDDLVVIRVNKNALVKDFKVGDYFSFYLFLSDPENKKQFDVSMGPAAGEITAINTKTDYLHNFYTVRVASQQEVMDSAKLNGYSSKSQKNTWNAEQLETEYKGLKIGGFTISGNSIKFSVDYTAKNKVESWRDAQYEVDMNYTFELKDLNVTCDGFGSALTGNIDKALFQVDYTLVNTFTAESELKVAPDNNRNGKFLNNLGRSRFTGKGAAGADEIKIARVYQSIGYGFLLEFYVYLTIHVDGSIKVSITNECHRGFKVVKNVFQKLDIPDTSKTSAEINLNVEVALNLEVALKWGTKKSKAWIDIKATAGFGVTATSKVMILTEDKLHCTKVEYGFVPASELVEIAENADIDYCFDLSTYWFWELSGLSDKCLVGKVIRMVDEDFKLSTGKKTNPLKSWHWDDGEKVDACTKNYDGMEDADVTYNGKAFELSDYKVIIPELCCGMVWLVGLPADKDAMKEMGGLKVSVENTKVATAHVSGDTICIESVGIGSTQMIVETGNKRFRVECSITVEVNEY